MAGLRTVEDNGNVRGGYVGVVGASSLRARRRDQVRGSAAGSARLGGKDAMISTSRPTRSFRCTHRAPSFVAPSAPPVPRSLCPRPFRHRRHPRRPIRPRRCAWRWRSPRPASTRTSPPTRRPTRSSPTSSRRSLDYDYLARPVQLVPVTARGDADGRRTAAAATSSGSGRGSCSRPIRRSRASRASSTAADYAYSFKRLLDPAVKSPWLWLLDGKIVGADEARAQAQKTGRFDYDAPIARTRGRRPVHAAHPAQGARLPLSVRARGAEHWRRSRARSSRPTATTSARTRSAPGPTCSASTGAARGSCSRPIPAIARRPTCPRDRCRPRSQPVAAALKGKRLPVRRPHRDPDHRGRPGALARVPQPRARLPRHPAVASSSSRRSSTAG